MPIKNDQWIWDQKVLTNIIDPFYNQSENKLDDGSPVTSYGLSSMGYDLRLGSSFKILANTPRVWKGLSPEGNEYLIETKTKPVDYFDPCNPDHDVFTDVRVSHGLIMPPGGFALGVTQERIKIPRDIMGICMEKSTVARCGLRVTVTPLEPEWEGYLTLELSNQTDTNLLLTVGMGITQLLFLQSDSPVLRSYKDRNGKYQNQPAFPVAPL